MSTAHRLLAAQFPQWADLEITPVTPSGTDNEMFRLGEDMALRLPREKSAATHITKERQWLGVLAPHLPLAIPDQLALGSPSEIFPWSWAVYRWLPGRPADPGHLADPARAARDLGAFVAALRQVDATGGPPSSRATDHAAARWPSGTPRPETRSPNSVRCST